MKKIGSIIVVIIYALSIIPSKAYAASEADCAIWICLPGGFPTGCAAAHSAFKHRIKNGRAPLPDLSSCTTGPDGQSSKGYYQFGYEYFEPCKRGYILEQKQNEANAMNGRCVLRNCAPNEWKDDCHTIDSYTAIRRPSPSYVKMWVEGHYLGQFFY